jgi:hypothetical protein
MVTNCCHPWLLAVSHSGASCLPYVPRATDRTLTSHAFTRETLRSLQATSSQLSFSRHLVKARNKLVDDVTFLVQHNNSLPCWGYCLLWTRLKADASYTFCWHSRQCTCSAWRSKQGPSIMTEVLFGFLKTLQQMLQAWQRSDNALDLQSAECCQDCRLSSSRSNAVFLSPSGRIPRYNIQIDWLMLHQHSKFPFTH